MTSLRIHWREAACASRRLHSVASLGLWWILAACALAGAPAMAQAPPPEGFTVTAGVDRPAMFVADRVTYTVEIACPRGYDILTADLGRDRLKLTGLDLVGSDNSRREEDGVTRYRFEYVLTTYRVDVATPTIGSFPVRYYLTRAGQRPEEAAPAGSLTVPAVAIAFRSLLPDDQAIYDVRDARVVPPSGPIVRMLQPAGIALILISIVPTAVLLLRMGESLRARRRRAAPRSSRQTREAARAALEELRGIDGDTPDARRDGFARLDALVRQHVTDACGVPAAGMTPDEIEAALQPCAARVPVAPVVAVLASCELARYADAGLQPSRQAWREALDRTQEILSHGR